MNQDILWQFGAIALALLVFLMWFLFMMWRFSVQQGRLLRSVKISLNKIEYYLEQSGMKPKKSMHQPKGVAKGVVRAMAERRIVAEEKNVEPVVLPKSIAISKDEPISKYEGVSMPDDVEIDFIDRE